MLEGTSRFVLEVLPYLLSALIAAVVVPGFLYSQAPEMKAAVAQNAPRLEMIHWGHVVLSPVSDKSAGGQLAYR